MIQTKEHEYLARTATLMRRMQAKVVRLDGDLVEQDIAARRQEALLGLEFAKQVDRIETALKTLRTNISVEQWCKQTCGVDMGAMRRRKRLYKLWKEYEAKRREMGACGQTGLLFALSLVSETASEYATTDLVADTRSGRRTTNSAIQATGRRKASAPRPDTSRSKFITGDALIELRKMPAKSVNVILTSPPYWPAKRAYGGNGVGFEKTALEYLAKLVAIFSEAKRVLKDDGILWVSIDDSYLDGNLLFLPSRMGMAMQDDGWVCRSEIIWFKGAARRPESVTNRVTKSHEKIFMFTKQRRYFYNPDPIREPLVRPYTTTLGKHKPGVMRRDKNRPARVYLNPMGRNSGSVWEITPGNYRGDHAATMPPELVQRCLSVSCPDGGTVMDCFGGAGTTALVALKLGHRAISIEVNPAYTKEARQRIIEELGDDDRGLDALAAD